MAKTCEHSVNLEFGMMVSDEVAMEIRTDLWRD
jgi:hypothetical protein